MMDIEEPKTKDIKRILTTKGPLPFEGPTQSMLSFSHEYFNPPVSTLKSVPITLETLQFHKSSPCNLENASITATLFEHQLVELGFSSNANNIFIIDCSKYTENFKVPDNLKKYNVVKGFVFRFPKAIVPSLNKNTNMVVNKEVEASTSKQYIEKQIEYQFSLTTSFELCGFLGPLNLPQQMDQVKLEQASNGHSYLKILKRTCQCYAEFSKKTECPIMINLSHHFTNNCFQIIYRNKQLQQKRMIGFQNLITFLFKVFPENVNFERIVLSNPNFIFSETLSQENNDFVVSHRIINLDQLRNIFQRGFQVCFELARYQNRQALYVIGLLLKEFPKQIILGYGIRFKTDTIPFGGEGLGMKKSLSIIKQICKDEQLIFKSRNNNILSLLAWNIKKQQIKQVFMWKCVGCSKQSPQTQQAFRKFGKDFCSIGCLKAYKF